PGRQHLARQGRAGDQRLAGQPGGHHRRGDGGEASAPRRGAREAQADQALVRSGFIMGEIRKAACIGGGVIGAGWAARLLLNGIDVAMYDPDPEAERKVSEVLANAERAYSAMVLFPLGPKGKLSFAKTIAEAVKDAEFIQESAPE